MKNFVKAKDRNGTACLYLRQTFPLFSDAKIRKGVFTGPHNRSLLSDEVFERIIRGDEQRAWHAFREVDSGFLGNRRADYYKDLAERFHQEFAAMEGRYKGKCSPLMLAYYCWTSMCDSPNSTINRQTKKARLH